ncbi:hypothetical protein D9611_002829 [Ephemerocybe angulata]|uniref:Nucleoporin NUP188 n=1 Tax=Ephemerocybe angulata TaxID=980116 RepID=A0A8H5FDL0_9AGAR|nr:hypothetical protein D9611_002829 [Tulosesus angulatus]
MSNISESSVRSNLIDISYAQLHEILGAGLEGVTPEALKGYLETRKDVLGNIRSIFGKPSDASRKKIQSGSVTLPDGVTVKVEEADKEFIFAISSRYQIDEVQALILLRSFLYNRGLPETVKADSAAEMVEELVLAIAPYYYSEKLCVVRLLGPLLRAVVDPEEPLYRIAEDIVPRIAPDPVQFALDVVAEYSAKTKEPLPKKLRSAPKAAQEWIKQNLKEQLALLEVLFWAMWGFVPCAPTIVLKVLEAAYATSLGTNQENDTLMLDAESQQLKEDCYAFWILITTEVLELETLGHEESLELSTTPSGKTLYVASPDTLLKIHDLVLSNTNSQFVCTYLGWTYVLSRIVAKAKSLDSIPPAYETFLNTINPTLTRAFTQDPEPIHIGMAKACLNPDAGLFPLLNSLLTKSPVFVLSAAWRTGSSVTEPNAIAFRSAMKGLVIALVELVEVEYIPDFDGLVDVWVALFGRSESSCVAPLCSQYWQQDYKLNPARAAIIDVARNRFPVQIQPLLKLLRAMTGAGFLETDPLSTADHGPEGDVLSPERQVCDRFVYYFFRQLPRYAQYIPLSECTGPHPVYEKQPERYSSGSTTFTYTNTRPIRLPGGSCLKARSIGTVISADSSDHIVVSWLHEHSGWKLILEILTDYVNRRHLHQKSGGPLQDLSFARRAASTSAITLHIAQAGMEINEDNDEVIVTESLDLVRSIIQANPDLAEMLMASLEDGEPVVSHLRTELQPPDLVQLTTMILEEALSRSNGRARSDTRIQLITSALSVLSALLANPTYSNRVWLYIRSTTALFGTEKRPGNASGVLSSERATGHYTMTLALLYLVQQLFYDATLSILPDNTKLQQLKEEVLLRAVRFVHTEIWIEHLGWKYAQLGDRFEIGRRIASLYSSILKLSPLTVENRPYALLSQTIADVLLFKATTSTISPLVSSLSSGAHISRMLRSSRRYGDTRRLLLLLDALLQLSRQILNLKMNSGAAAAAKPSLLEQLFCARVIGPGAATQENIISRQEPIDVLAGYVRDRDIGPDVPLQAIRLLTTLATSMSLVSPSPPTIIGHLSRPEEVVSSFVRIIEHPYDDVDLRIAIWNFITLVVDTEPALGGLFVTGKFRMAVDVKMEAEDVKGKKKEEVDVKEKAVVPVGKSAQRNTLSTANEFLSSWKQLWEFNPQLLSTILHFLTVVWEHALEHKASISAMQADPKFWAIISGIIQEEVGPVPEYETTEYLMIEKLRHSNHHEAVVFHAYRTLAKSFAVQLASLDIGYHLQSTASNGAPKKPQSFLALEPRFKVEEELSELLSEAAPSPYAPSLYDKVTEILKRDFPGLSLSELESQDPLSDRQYGDRFTFSLPLLQERLQAYRAVLEVDPMEEDPTDVVTRAVLSINLNLSLTHAQNALGESWETLLRHSIPYLRSDAGVRPILINIAADISSGIALEKRQGEMMASIHGTRLSLLLAILEVAWFSSTPKPAETKAFFSLVKNLRDIVLNKAQAPITSFMSTLPNPFHRPLLQLIFFCAKEAGLLMNRPNVPNSDQRLTIFQTIEAALNLVLEGLAIVFVAAQSRQDVDLDRDMELLVSVFQQCSRPDVSPSSTYWLSRCQETDVMRSSLELFSRTDLSGLSNLPLLLSRKHPLYAPHILLFHMAVVSNPIAAERLASEGLLSAYSNNSISAAISSGRVDVIVPELPGERSPVHLEYCSMLAIVAAVITAFGRHNHYFDAEACGFVQLYGDQISRALSWTVGDSITMPLVEEIEQTVNLFYAIAASVPTAAKLNPAVEKVLRVFTSHSLLLLQQINYAVTHPNHLGSLFEPITSDERTQHEKSQGIADPLKRPLIAHLVHRLFRLSSNIVGTLVCISKADMVLVGNQEDWPLNEALVVPHSKVVLGEPASLGTLLELGNCSLDIIKDFVNRPAGQALTPVTANATRSTSSLDVRQGLITARRNLESVCVYAVTQLAMWLSKPEFDVGSGQEDGDEAMDEGGPGGQGGGSTVGTVALGSLSKDRRPGAQRSSTSISMAERLRRGMTGDMASDLLSLLNKAKPLIAKSDGVIGEKTKPVDVTQALIVFVQERIVTKS